MMRLTKYFSSLLLCLNACALLSAQPIKVLFKEGSVHGFLALCTMEGKVVAEGDLVQVTQGEKVTSQLVFNFKDGSVDSETAVFSQTREFRLLSDHHIQKGPSFPKPMDVLIRASSGLVTVRYEDKGAEKVETRHLDIPLDVANGIVPNILKNISPEAQQTEVSYVVAAPKPQIVKLAISPKGQETFSVLGVKKKALHFVVKVKLGGVEGVLAPIVGKQPEDTNIWIAEGKPPAFVRSDGPSFLGAPILSTQMTSPTWAAFPTSR